MNNVWIVEVTWTDSPSSYRHKSWHPVAGVGLDREQGRKILADWKARNPNDRFRLRRYDAALPKLKAKP
jgi:hypothetical protein